MPGLLRTVNGTTTLFATASIKSKQEGILSANVDVVANPRSGVMDFFLNITQNACNLATIKIQSLTRTSSRLTASFGKQVKGACSANIIFRDQKGKLTARGFINKKAIVPIKFGGCGCQDGCSCGGSQKVRFKDGTTLNVRIGKSLNLALKRLFTKLARELKKLTPRRSRAAVAAAAANDREACRANCVRIGNACRAACGIFAPLCAPICATAQGVCIIQCGF
ncbi:hypothetical protein [Paenibacillus sp. CF384]|uniref:hypothetical protein n=1 Tax=Paenibacillus sp. CF384 TaxID=1884382 RepID=UPI000899243B|nr:hypothetical protein [Paenibacillus sp. CF384]SDX55744.1 hypothetical protein SAMN05518855_101674 [Paenibacillus sp. CF384]